MSDIYYLIQILSVFLVLLLVIIMYYHCFSDNNRQKKKHIPEIAPIITDFPELCKHHQTYTISQNNDGEMWNFTLYCKYKNLALSYQTNSSKYIGCDASSCTHSALYLIKRYLVYLVHQSDEPHDLLIHKFSAQKRRIVGILRFKIDQIKWPIDWAIQYKRITVVGPCIYIQDIIINIQTMRIIKC